MINNLHAHFKNYESPPPHHHMGDPDRPRAKHKLYTVLNSTKYKCTDWPCHVPERHVQILKLRGYKYTCPYFSFNIIRQKTNPKNKYFDKKGSNLGKIRLTSWNARPCPWTKKSNFKVYVTGSNIDFKIRYSRAP